MQTCIASGLVLTFSADCAVTGACITTRALV